MLLHTFKHTHCASPFSLCVCLQASVWQRFFPSPTCQQWWIVFPPHPISLCCDWRLESWPNVLRTVSISCWHLAANNESIWGLHLRPLSPLLLPFPKPFFSFQFHLRPLALAPCSLTSCVYPSVSWTLNCILADGTVHLAKVQAIKELVVWSRSDGVCYQCQSMPYPWTPSLRVGELSPAVAFNLSLIYCTTCSQTTDVHVWKLLAKDFEQLAWCT